MRILFVSKLCGYYGGVEQIVEDYARGLAGRGHQCYLAYSEEGRDPDIYGATFEQVHACSQLGESDKGSDFEGIVRSVSPDVIFVHKVDSLPAALEDLTEFRRVLLVEDNDYWCPKGTGYYTGIRRTCRVAAGIPCYLDGAFLERNASGVMPVKPRNLARKIREMRRNHLFDSILVLSQFLKRQLVLNGYPPERVNVLNPVLNHPAPRPRSLPQEPRVLFVGSLIRGKGVDLLLRALARMSSPFHLDIVGKGECEKELRALASRLGIEERTRFVGWVSHDQISEYYQEARVVVVPSCWPEPYGLIGQESMWFARPVVAFDVGGIQDWCENGVTGYLVPEKDIAAFSFAVERLLTDFKLARNMGDNGLRKARSEFLFEENVDRLEEYLKGS